MVKASNFIRLGQWNVNEKVKRKKGKKNEKTNKQKKTVTTDNQRLIYLIVVKKKRNIFPTLSLLIWTSPRAKYQRKDSQYYEKGTDLG